MSIAALFSIVFMLFGLGCASFIKDSCPTMAEEPVSGCRARVKCSQKKTNYSVGLSPSGQVADNFGLEPEQPSASTENYTHCIAKDLEMQKSVNQINKNK